MTERRQCIECGRGARALDCECHACGGAVHGSSLSAMHVASAGGVGLWCLDQVFSGAFARRMVDDFLAQSCPG